MQVFFKARDPQAVELEAVAQRRMRFLFRRSNWLLPRATVRLSDVSGSSSGINKRCQVEIKSDVAGSVMVTSVARDSRTALDNALARAARFLMRQWRRQPAIPLSNGKQSSG